MSRFRALTLKLAALVCFAGPVAAQANPDSLTTPEADSAVQVDTSAVDSAATARALLVELDSAYTHLFELVDSMETLEGDQLALLRVGAGPLLDSIRALRRSMVRELTGMSPEGPSVDSIRSTFQGFVEREFMLAESGIEAVAEEVDSLRALRDTIQVTALADLENQIGRRNAQLDTTLAFEWESLRELDTVGIDASEQWDTLDRFVLNRAAELVGRVQLALQDRDFIQQRLQDARAPDADPGVAAELELRERVARQRITNLSRNLRFSADLLQARGLPTAAYRQLLLQATGEVTTDVLDPTVALGLIRDWVGGLWVWIVEVGPTFLVQMAIVAGSVVLFRVLFRVIWATFTRTAGRMMSRLLARLIERVLMPVATVVGLGAGLTTIGVDPTAFLAGLGVLGVIVGLALQDSLANLAAGVFILIYRPFDVDDIVSAGGVTGTVRDMGLASTTIVTFDNRRLFVPNSKVWGEVIENRSAERQRRVDVRLRVTHQEDPDRIIRMAEEVCAGYDLVLDTPEVLVFVTSIDDSLVELEVRAWAPTPDWWTVSTQLPRLITKRLRTEGIEPPYPRQVEYEVTEPAPGAARE